MDNLARDLQQPLEDLDRKIKPFMYEPENEHNEEFVYKFSDQRKPHEN
jgi:hypothetical protein